MNDLPPKGPLVSIIISFLNEEKYLKETIQSVLGQEYRNWEIILIDDGSTDKSTQIAQEFATLFPDKIFYHEHEKHANKGLSTSRNFGLTKSRGTYIAILDADDVWLPTKLAVQMAIVVKNPKAKMVAEGSIYWHDWADPQVKNVPIPVGAPQDKIFDPPQLLEILYPLGEGAAPCPSGLLLEKEAFQKVGGFEETFIKEYGLYEDQAFLSKMYLNEKVYISSACNNLYRQRPESIVHSVRADGKYHKVRQYYLEWLHKYLKQNGFMHPPISSLLKKSMFPYHYPALHNITTSLPKLAVRMLRKMFSLN